MRMYLACLLLFVASVSTPLGATADNDTEASAVAIFDKQCSKCHQIGEGASNTAGPHLNNLNERKFGSVEDYRYADGLLQASTKGLLWSKDALNEWLKDPILYIKQVTGDDTAHTRMIYRVSDEVNRKLIVEYLLTLPKQAPSPDGQESDETQSASKCLRDPQPNVDLSNCDLVRVDFSNADLRSADLRYTRLIAANLNKANLSGADLTGASLGGADLRGADLSGANLTDATMIKALIPGANTDRALFHNTIYVNARRCSATSVGECQ